MARCGKAWLLSATVSVSWLPYLFGWLITPLKMRYLWLIYNPDDQNVHLMWARQAMEGAWRFHDLFTTEPHPGLFFNLYALLLGWFCRLTNIPLHFGYQIFRTAVAFAFLATAFWFGSLFLRGERTRKAYQWLVCFSSGLGFLPVLWWWQTKNRPPFYFVDVSPELTMPEANSFLSVCVAPMAALGVTLVMLFLGNLYRACQLLGANSRSHLLLAVLCGVVVANVHSYAAVPMLIAVALWQLSHAAFTGTMLWRRWAISAAAGLPCMVVLAIQAFVFSQDPAFAQKAATPTLTPSPFILLGSYGIVALMAVLALLTIGHRLRQSETDWLLPLSWLIALMIAIHLPVSFQRKMIEGLHVVLCLLAAVAWERWTQRFNEIRHRLALAALVFLTVPSQGAFLALNGYWMVHNNLLPERRLMPTYFLSETHLQLMGWLRENAEKDDAVLCHPMLGNYLPVLTGRKVFVGHWAETLNFRQKLSQAMAVWEGRLPPEEAQAFFQRHRLRYALETDFERGAVKGATALRRYGEVVYQVGDDVIVRFSKQ